jgi:hypothetical protein
MLIMSAVVPIFHAVRAHYDRSANLGHPTRRQNWHEAFAQVEAAVHPVLLYCRTFVAIIFGRSARSAWIDRICRYLLWQRGNSRECAFC